MSKNLIQTFEAHSALHYLIDDLEPPSSFPITEFLERTFDAMDLPIPEHHEFVLSRDEARNLVLLNRYGLVLEIALKNKLIDQPYAHLLRPFLSHKIDHYDFRIQPGINTGISEEQVAYYYAYIANNTGIRRIDDHAFNIGLIPGTDYPVHLDLNKRDFFKIPNFALLDTFQLNHYGALIDAFVKAFENPLGFQKTKMKDALKLAEDFKGLGLLMSMWETTDQSLVVNAAQAYAMRCG